MKSRIFFTLSSLTLLTAAAALAQSGSVMHADIPFEFHVGKTVLPAGHYDIRPNYLQGILFLKCAECSQAGALVRTTGTEAATLPKTGELVFHRYGEMYFLSRVWSPGYHQGSELPPSKSEREFLRGGSSGLAADIAILAR